MQQHSAGAGRMGLSLRLALLQAEEEERLRAEQYARFQQQQQQEQQAQFINNLFGRRQQRTQQQQQPGNGRPGAGSKWGPVIDVSWPAAAAATAVLVPLPGAHCLVWPHSYRV